MPDTYDEYIDHAARAAFTGEAEPVPGALRARIEADGAVKALRALADDLSNRKVRSSPWAGAYAAAAAAAHVRADRIEQEGHL